MSSLVKALLDLPPGCMCEFNNIEDRNSLEIAMRYYLPNALKPAMCRVEINKDILDSLAIDLEGVIVQNIDTMMEKIWKYIADEEGFSV
jgi:hypothetical protein